MSSDSNVVYLERHRSAGAALDDYDRLRRLGLKRLLTMLCHMLDRADDALFDMAGSPAADSAGYFAAMRQLRLRRRELEEAFQRELLAQFRGLRSRGSLHEPRGLVRRSALTGADTELQLAEEAMIAKARGHQPQVYAQLAQRLTQLLKGRPVDADSNPFDPRQVCQAFCRAAAGLELELNARLVVFKLFDRHVMEQLPALVEEAGALLHAAETAAEAGAPPGEDPEQLTERLFRLVTRHKHGRWGGSTEPSRNASLREVIDALAALQQSTAGAAGDALAADLKTLLDSALRRSSGARLGRPEDDVADVVGMLFAVILRDPALPRSIKSLIARLQIPVLKVALLDHGFFSNRAHPARELINELARATLGWAESAHSEHDPLYRKVDYVVTRINEKFADDLAIFSLLLRDFRDFLAQERDRARLIEERTCQAAEGKIKVDAARREVDAAIAQRLAQDEWPEIVRRLLVVPWSKLLFITCLRDGADSERFRFELGVIDRLLWTLQPKRTAEERKRLLREIPQLLQDLREGLDAVLYEPEEMTRLFKGLEAEHIRSLSPVAAAASAEERLRPAADAAVPSGAAVDAEVQTQLCELPEGTWIEFSQQRRTPMRAKLAARLDGGRRLVFVNRAGFQCADMSVAELAAELDAGRAWMLDDRMLFDRALQEVVATLQQRCPDA